jgi:16S rRNA (adenine1518-N6/adenine1519-N6)-dimethyltransferase
VLSVLIRHCANVELLLKLPPGAFRPPPKVRSAVVRLNFHPPDPPVRDRQTFERLVQTVFTHRRKTLANALRSWGQSPGLSPGLSPSLSPGLSLDLSRRPETLTVAEFAALADVFSSP